MVCAHTGRLRLARGLLRQRGRRRLRTKQLMGWLARNASHAKLPSMSCALLPTRVLPIHRLEAERVEAERVEAERVEAERVEAERVEEQVAQPPRKPSMVVHLLGAGWACMRR